MCGSNPHLSIKITLIGEFSLVGNREREDMGMCEHYECPYKGCKYHEFFDEQKHEEYKERSYKFFPDNGEEMEDCTLYLDV